MDRYFVLFIVLFLIIYGVCFMVPSGAAAGLKCIIKINARHASGFGRFRAILESLYVRSAPVLLAASRADITPDPVYVCPRWKNRKCKIS